VIRIAGVSREIRGKKILDGINLEIRDEEIFTLIGPSGSGKTSLIRIIDLLDVPTAGTIFFDGADSASSRSGRLALRRRMALVFQKPAVLNTTVAKNVALGLKFRGVDGPEIERRVEAALDLVGLAGFSGRRAVTLSGGESQRVALARAMVTEPDILLLDEPTANLDPVTSELIEDLIIRFNREFKTTIILSTHDMVQGQRLATRIGVIMNGKIAQVGDLHEIFYQPLGVEIAHFVGIDTILHGIVEKNDRGHAIISAGRSRIEAITPIQPGRHVGIYIRPEEVTVYFLQGGGPAQSSVRNRFSGTITRIVPFGPFIRMTVDCGFVMTAMITRRSCEELGLAVGSLVCLGVKASSIHVLPEAP
jgi:tungstate transport system ATP-binding protein